MQDDLLGINSLEGATPKDVFGAYSIDVKAFPQKGGAIKPNTEGQPFGYEEDPDFYSQNTPQHTHDGINAKPIGLEKIGGFVETILSEPTYVPRNVFQQLKIFDVDDNDQLSIYDRVSRLWKFIPLSTKKFSKSQLQLPVTSAGDFGWTVAGTGADSIPYSNGAEIFSNSLEFEFFSKLIGNNGVIDFSFDKQLRLETVLSPRFTNAGNKGSFGLYGNNTDTPSDLSDLTNTERSIRWIMDGPYLYAVWSDGITVLTHLISGVTVAAGTGIRLKILWNPGVNIKWYVNDVLLNVSTTNIPASGPVFLEISGITGTAGNSGYYVHFPQLSLEN